MPKLLRALLVVWFGSIGGAVSIFFSQLILARYLTVEDYGTFATILGVMNIFSPLAGAGIGGYWLRLRGKGQKLRKSIMWISVRVVTGSCALVSMLCVLISWLSAQNLVYLVVAILLVSQVFQQCLLTLAISAAQLNGKFTNIGLIQSAPQLLRLLFVVLGCVFLINIYMASVAYMTAALLSSIFLCRFVIKNLRQVGESGKAYFDITWISKVLKLSLPFAMNQFLNILIMQGVVYFVSLQYGGTIAAQYSVCISILFFIYILPNALFGQLLLPRLHQASFGDKTVYIELFRAGCGMMVVSGVLGGIGVYLLGGFGVTILFGEKYTYASQMMTLCAFVIPFRFLATSVGAVLVTRNFLKIKLICMIVSAVCQFGLIPLFLIAYGELAPMIALILAELLLMVLYLCVVVKFCFGLSSLVGWFNLVAWKDVLVLENKK